MTLFQRLVSQGICFVFNIRVFKVERSDKQLRLTFLLSLTLKPSDCRVNTHVIDDHIVIAYHAGGIKSVLLIVHWQSWIITLRLVMTSQMSMECSLTINHEQ